MKWRTFKDEVLVPHERDGVTHMVKEQVSRRVPVLPRDLDSLGLKAAGGLVLALTLVTVAWSTVSIGNLLHGGVGYAAAGMFDTAWGVCLLLEWLGRFDPGKRAFARKLGVVLVLITMGALFWDGLLAGSVALAVVGAMVSLIAKVLWLGVFKHIDRELSDADQQWVQAEISRANAQLAVAGVRRQAARAEARAAMELMAAERERYAWQAAEGGVPVPVPELADAGRRVELAEAVAGQEWPELAALRAERPAVEAEARPVTAEQDADERDVEALALYRAVMSTPGATADDREWAAERAEATARREPDDRPATAPTLVSVTAEPEPAPGGEPVDRVPQQRPRSIAAGVAELRAARITDPAVMAARLSALMARDVSVDSVKREIRRARAAERAAESGTDAGTGAYL
ncbi:hypothetical protein [Streptomyces sp. NPDC057686]|uniref:hypothetical protein n=1 Tax=Streptomyces TaxID=1883 RepID=UPI003676F19D